MTFHLTHRYGKMERGTCRSDFKALVQELDDQLKDGEHGNVAVTHESEWCLSVSRGGYVIYEHLEKGGERHMHAVSLENIVGLLSRLSQGDLVSLESEPWVPGY